MILLFDIDGTLLQSHGVGRRSIEAALADTLGDTFDTSDISFSGKTDGLIFREIVAAAQDRGLHAGPDAVARLEAAYAERMHAALPDAHVEALPGALELVHQLAADGVDLGLLTGNLQPLAFAKIERLGLGPAEFAFGAFGSDAHDREDLPAIAIRRAEAHLGRTVAPAEVAVIGDTPRDIACARAGGCIAVAVATGRYDAGALRDADLTLDTLADFRLADVEAVVA